MAEPKDKMRKNEDEMALTSMKHVTPSIKPGTPAMESYLQAGYPGMTVVKAKQIIKERQENPQQWPYEVMQQAEAFLEAYTGVPKVISKRKPWRVSGKRVVQE